MTSVDKALLQERVAELLKRPFFPQKSPGWFKDRQTRVTASECSSCLYKTKEVYKGFYQQFPKARRIKYNDTKGLNPYMSREEYIIQKPSEFYGEHAFVDSDATLWGKKYEDAIVRLYSILTGVPKIHEFGLVGDLELPWLGASPDGITPDGTMLEIKVPFLRKLNPNEIPIYYWIQTQIQMKCCNLEECDYIECKIIELSYNEFLDSTSKFKGIIMDLGNKEYIYPPNKEMTDAEFLNWKNSQKGNPLYYDVTEYQMHKITRNREWFDSVAGDIKETHDIITRFQNDREAFLAYKKAYYDVLHKDYLDTYDESECMIMSDIEDDNMTDTDDMDDLEDGEIFEEMEEGQIIE